MTDAQRDHHSPYYRELWLGPALVWLLLLAILAASAWSAFLPLGTFNPTINLSFSAAMLLILAAYLMDLRSASPILRMVATAGLFWVIFLFTLTFTDYLSRRPTVGAPPPLHGADRASEFPPG
jgi:cytochrome c oxidase subunit 4